MRALPAAGLLLIVVLLAPTAVAGYQPASLGLAELSHTLEGQMLIIHGVVRNLASGPLRAIVIDAYGYGPGGDLVASGSDGIPWAIPAGGAERFAIALPLGRQLVREYAVQVSLTGQPGSIASLRRGVDVGLYREHLRSLIRVRGEILHSFLIARADAAGFPVSQVVVQAAVWVLDPRADRFELLTLNFEVEPDRTATVFLGTPHALLLSLRLVDLRLKVSWSD